MRNVLKKIISDSFTDIRHIAPLAVLRIAFGTMMFVSILRFIAKGWIADFYINPKFHFTFYGFDWVRPMSPFEMYSVFVLMAVACLCITLGLYYQASVIAFFLCFSYIELIDVTYYLNHYYFISIVTFLLILVPANRYFSLDIIRKPSLKVTMVPGWTITIFKLQLFIVYFYAGISKLTYDWMILAMPLKIWLPANSHLPLIGSLLQEKWLAFLFSWFGAFFDLTIVFFLMNTSTRKIGYFFVVLFHIFTGWFFKIGMFPYIMICMTIIFFSENFHKRVIQMIKDLFSKMNGIYKKETPVLFNLNPIKRKIIYVALFFFFSFQLFFPFRYLLYPGRLLWTEEGYRFSWRVMLMEKGGTAFFYVEDPQTKKKMEVLNSSFLTRAQEKMMTTQPDMILQYAHFLEQEYKKKGIRNPIITVESYVTLNGSGSRPFINSSTDLSKEKESFHDKKWILPFQQIPVER